jgi:hypothetical protein
MRKMGWMSLLLVAAMAVGCTRDFNLTFRNLTRNPVDVALDGPARSEDVGTIGPAREMRFELKIKENYLPEPWTIQAGKLTRKFTFTKDTPTELWINIQEESIVGPLGKDDVVKESTKKSGSVKVIENQPVLKGDKPVMPPEGGGKTTEKGTIIKQEPVIE